MRSNLLATLLATTAIAVVASSAEAAPLKFGNHTFGGKFAVTAGQNSNAAASPAKAGKSFDDDEDEDDDLAELLEDNELDPDDLDDDTVDEDEDEDDDLAAVGTPAQVYRDSRVQYSFGVNHAYKFSDTFSWKTAVLAGVNRQMDRHELNRINWAVNTGAEFKIKQWDLTLSPTITYAQLEKAHKDQSESTIPGIAAKWKATKDWDFSARINKEFRNNVVPRTTNTNVTGLKVGTAYKLTAKDKISFNYSPKEDRNENNLKSKDAWSADIGYARKLPWDLTLGLAYKYGESTFINGADPRRDDEQHDYGIGLNKQFDNGMFAAVGAGYKGKKSNIANKGNHDKSVFVQTGYKF
ncbi:MAG: DUF560 domain-containing protein [Alphaproteobacteria bacterium]|nr:DUF560 domain-containing protein [Alphaproteobacteria bacterium]